MATFDENIRKIRGEAVLGTEIREAIAEAITQMDDAIISDINSYETRVTGTKTEAINAINGAVSTYTRRVDGYDQRLQTVETDIDNRDLFMNLSDLGNNDYKLTITNAGS